MVISKFKAIFLSLIQTIHPSSLAFYCVKSLQKGEHKFSRLDNNRYTGNSLRKHSLQSSWKRK